jgi:hypothetical protein
MLGAGPTFRNFGGASSLPGVALQQQEGAAGADSSPQGQAQEQAPQYKPCSGVQVPWQQQHALQLQQEALLHEQQHSPGSGSLRDRVRRRSTMLSIPPLQAVHLELNSQVGFAPNHARGAGCL